MSRKKNPAIAAAAVAPATTAEKKTRTARPAIDPATLPPQMPKLYSSREIQRLGILADDIVSLRARAQELIDRAEASALALSTVVTPDGPGIVDVTGRQVLETLQVLRDCPDGDKPFRDCVFEYATKTRAKFRLAAAQEKADELRSLFDTPAADKFHAEAGGNPADNDPQNGAPSSDDCPE